MSFDLTRAIQRQQGMPRAHKAVLLALAGHADPKTGRTFVGQAVLAAETGLSVRTVIRAMAALAEPSCGWITRERRHTGKGWRTSDHVVVHDPARVAAVQEAMLRLPLMVALAGGQPCGQPVECRVAYMTPCQLGLGDTMSVRLASETGENASKVNGLPSSYRPPKKPVHKEESKKPVQEEDRAGVDRPPARREAGGRSR